MPADVQSKINAVGVSWTGDFNAIALKKNQEKKNQDKSDELASYRTADIGLVLTGIGLGTVFYGRSKASATYPLTRQVFNNF